MKNYLAISLFFLLISCRLFDADIPTEKELLAKRLKEIDWNKVDKFPSVNECDSIKEESKQKLCFFDFLKLTLQQKLDSISTIKDNETTDTIQIKITVFPEAKMDFETIYKENSLIDRKKTDSILRLKFVDFPKVNPGTKQGIPVKTKFILPLIIKTEK